MSGEIGSIYHNSNRKEAGGALARSQSPRESGLSTKHNSLNSCYRQKEFTG